MYAKVPPTMAQDNTIRLFDLQLSTGATISPFVWATKYALKHKGFDIDIVPGGFTGIRERTGGFHDRVPVIVDDGKWIKESWDIAEYLDTQYPERPMLLAGESMKVLTKFIDSWIWATAIRPWFSCYILDYHNLSLPQDQAYVRESPPDAVPAGTQARRRPGRPRGATAAGATAARSPAPTPEADPVAGWPAA
jgi:glutathione S-transferase